MSSMPSSRPRISSSTLTAVSPNSTARNSMTLPWRKCGAEPLFRGGCGVRKGAGDLLLRDDTHGRLRSAALRSDSGARLLGQYGPPPDAPATVVFVQPGRCLTESSAGLAA